MVARDGIELELLAPVGVTRVDVAAAIAARVGGRVQHGFKHRVDGELAPGRPRCTLSFAERVVAADGARVVDVVDDPTIRDFADDGRRQPVLLLDDARLALRAADVCWSNDDDDDDDVGARVAAALSMWGAQLEGARIVDRVDQVLAVVGDEPAAHARVCEIVTAPLARDERDALLRVILDVATGLGCTVPTTAALHVHLDAGPWRDARRLSRLVVGWNAQRAEHVARLRTNPRCLKLGAFPDDVIRVAERVLADTATMPWSTVAAAFVLAGVKKELDLNLRGVLDARPLQRTLEIRCLPMSLDVDDVIASIDDAVALLEAMAPQRSTI